MSRTKTFLHNSASTAIQQISVMLAGFIIPRIMLTCYGSEVNGLVTSLTQFVNYFSLVEAGLSGAAVYALYKPLAEHDIGAVNGILAAAKRFYVQAGWIFVGLTVCLAILYPNFVSATHLSGTDIAVLALILGINSALELFTLAKYRALLTASQKTYVISWASLVYVLLNTLIIVTLAKAGLSVVWVRLFAVTAILLRCAILFFYTRSHYKYLDYSVTPNTKALDRRWDALYLQILGAIHIGAPTIILTIVNGDLKIVSIYAVFNMVLAGINSILSIFISGLSAAFGDIIVRGERKTLQVAYGQFELAYYALITVVYFVAYVMIMPFIKLYTTGITDANYSIPLLGALFVLNGYLYNLKTPQGMLVISAGMYRETRWRTTIQGAIMVIGGLLLAKPLGIAGVMLASIASNLYRDIDLLFFIPRHVTGLAVKLTLQHWGMSGVALILLVVLAKYITFDPSSYIEWFIWAGMWCLLAGALVLCVAFIFNRKECYGLLHRIKGMVKSNE